MTSYTCPKCHAEMDLVLKDKKRKLVCASCEIAPDPLQDAKAQNWANSPLVAPKVSPEQ